MHRLTLGVALFVLACIPAGDDAPGKDAAPDSDLVDDTSFPVLVTPWQQAVEVRLDGVPVAGAVVMQGGASEHGWTDADGRAVVFVEPTLSDVPVVVGAHPEARTAGVDLRRGEVPLAVVELVRFATDDNAAYVFQDPGTPERNEDTSVCSHCHIRQAEDWFASSHATSASNPEVHDLYMGTAALEDAACTEAGGTMAQTRRPGGGLVMACRLGDGVLPDLNPACDASSTCDEPSATGACADCHAPGMDGMLGGRDLLEAEGIAHDHGVHCDVCHKVADVDLDAPAGVAGRLVIVRPSEPSPLAALDWAPLTFGPLLDVLNPRMGSVGFSPHADASFCAGCHEHEQAVLVPGVSLDASRWPDGTLPIHSTYSEWAAGPLSEVVPCQGCHMPPDPAAGNAADIDLQDTLEPGRTGGYWRAPGSVRRHVWFGPRSTEDDLIRRALVLAVHPVDGASEADVVVSQQGPGHAVPTGEPSRSVVLHVSATCAGLPWPVVDGPAIPAYGGTKALRTTDEGWTTWPDAVVGDVIRVVDDGGWRDDPGVGPFGDGTFDAQAKGLPNWRVVGSRTVVAVAPDGTVTLDAPLPDGDLALLGSPPVPDDASAAYLAGAPGMAYARVLADADGKQMVPHHKAVDVVSDNRLMPGEAWTGRYRWAACADLAVTARLTWQAYPAWLAHERGWPNPVRPMAEVTR